MKTSKTTITIFLFALFTCTMSIGQISGNQVYQSNSRSVSAPQSKQTVSINNSILQVSVSLLMNTKADGFSITLGLNEESETVLQCNTKINGRIDGFISKIKTLGIKKDDYYVDFIAQTKVYDFEVEGLNSHQFEKGFEIKKNIIVSTKNITDLEKIITMASQFAIYDIIKVEYYDENSNEMHEQLFDDALKMAEIKKDKYLKSFKKKIVGTPDATESFEVYYPKNQYKTYQAFESAEVETHYNKRNTNYTKKLARKNKSFYYDGVSTAGFDKVIQPNQTEVGIQYTLTLTVSYKIDTSI